MIHFDATNRRWLVSADEGHLTEAQIYQEIIRQYLEKYFPGEVKKEWSVSVGATDAFRHKAIYAPRLDIAVGPFNTKIETLPENQRNIVFSGIGHPFIQRLRNNGNNLDFEKFNKSPRCLLAVEISFSGSSKHILGDFTNASMMGLVGVVLAGKKNYVKVTRILNYLKLVRDVGKAPADLFGNLVVYKVEDFLKLLNIMKK